MLKCKRFGTAVFDENPLASNSGPVSVHLWALKEQRSVFKLAVHCIQPPTCEPFFAEYVDNEHAAGGQTSVNIPQNPEIIRFILEITERCEQTARQIESSRTLEPPHIFLNPFDLGPGRACPLAR